LEEKESSPPINKKPQKKPDGQIDGKAGPAKAIRKRKRGEYCKVKIVSRSERKRWERREGSNGRGDRGCRGGGGMEDGGGERGVGEGN